MKHIKLFENWAEELQVPEYLRRDWVAPKDTYPANHPKIRALLRCVNVDLGWSNGKNYFPNFHHFYEFQDLGFLRPDGYDSLKMSQWLCKYILQNFDGLPEVRNDLRLYNNNIKSLKGLENRKFKEKFLLNASLLENLKYCPETQQFDFYQNPLLSYYGIKNVNIADFPKNLCGVHSYLRTKFKEENLNNIEFHAEKFCNFESKEYNDEQTNNISINPWFNIYNDPNEVENYDFLFIPFYMNSEKFRDCAREYIENLDMSGVTRGKESLW